MRINPSFSFYVLERQKESGYIPSVVFCSTRGVDVGGVGEHGQRRHNMVSIDIQDMSALWKMQLHVSQRDAALPRAEETYI